jgi:hypothetical protein
MRPRVHQRGSGNAAMKKARGIFARASYAVLMNTEFVEDSVTRSQAFSRSRARKMRVPVNNRRKTGTPACAISAFTRVPSKTGVNALKDALWRRAKVADFAPAAAATL